MALIQCPECGKEISELANSCPNCGRPIINPVKIQKMKTEPKKEKHTVRIVLNLIGLIFSFMIFMIIFQSNGGVEGNQELFMGALWFMIPAIIGLCGRNNKAATIVSASFYFWGALVSLIESFLHMPCIYFFIMEIVFGIILMINGLTQKKKAL